MRISRLKVSTAAINYFSSGIHIAASVALDNSWIGIAGVGWAIAGTITMVDAIREAEKSETNEKVEVNEIKRLPKRLAK